MTDTRLLSEFVEAWRAGERPDIDEYLARAGAEDREPLAAEISAFLQSAPAPEYSAQTLDRLLADPEVIALARLPSELGLWPAALPRLCRQSRVRREDLVARLAGRLGVAGREAKVRRYYHRMETGELDPAGISRRVLDELASILGVSADELVEDSELRGFVRPLPEAAFGRTYVDPEADKLAAETIQTDDGSEEWDEVDELFRGGR
ncbi:MAG: hypothetical protein M3Y17_12920 [Actinomycetota bacterium]|nr:hypothetical protein [Actinomycetota bacterium]